jgi:hypothetical protein
MKHPNLPVTTLITSLQFFGLSPKNDKTNLRQANLMALLCSISVQVTNIDIEEAESSKPVVVTPLVWALCQQCMTDAGFTDYSNPVPAGDVKLKRIFYPVRTCRDPEHFILTHFFSEAQGTIDTIRILTSDPRFRPQCFRRMSVHVNSPATYFLKSYGQFIERIEITVNDEDEEDDENEALHFRFCLESCAPSLKRLVVTNVQSFSDFSGFSLFVKLTHLTFKNCSLCDEDFIQLAGLTSLRELYFSQVGELTFGADERKVRTRAAMLLVRQIEDTFLALSHTLTNFQFEFTSYAADINVAAARHLGKLTCLKIVTLGSTTGFGTWDTFFPFLTDFHLEANQHDGEKIKVPSFLSKSTRLKTLLLNLHFVDDKDEVLPVSSESFKPDFDQLLTDSFPQMADSLTTLSLQSHNISFETMQSLAKLKKLETIKLQNICFNFTELGSATWDHLSETLKTVDIQRTNLKAVDFLAPCKSLTSLDLTRCYQLQSVTALQYLTGLRTLTLAYFNPKLLDGDQFCSALENLQNLARVDLILSKKREEADPPVAWKQSSVQKLKYLKTLVLGSKMLGVTTSWKDEQVKAFCSVPNLDTLVIENCPNLTNEVAFSIAEMKTVKCLHCATNVLPKDSFEAFMLKRCLPNCEIQVLDSASGNKFIVEKESFVAGGCRRQRNSI